MTIDVEVSPVERLKAAAEPLRWRILELLAGEELCVCHLVETLGAPQSLISHHLRVLRTAGLVEAERFRYWTYYRLHRPALAELSGLLAGLAADVGGPGPPRRACC